MVWYGTPGTGGYQQGTQGTGTQGTGTQGTGTQGTVAQATGGYQKQGAVGYQQGTRVLAHRALLRRPLAATSSKPPALFDSYLFY